MSNCTVCGNKIVMMSQQGTDVCSENCLKLSRERGTTTINKSSGVTRHRGVGDSPTKPRDTTTF